MKLICALLLVMLASSSAAAEITAEDVRNQLNAMLAERRFENDRRLEAMEKQVAAATQLLSQRIDGNVKARDSVTADLKELLETKISAVLSAVQAANASSKEAIDKAASATEKRFESVNEWRAQSKDREVQFMPRVEADVKTKGLSDQVGIINQRLDQLTGRDQGASTLWTVLVGAVGLLIGALGVAIALRRAHVNDPSNEHIRTDIEMSRASAAISSELSNISARLNRLEGVASTR